MKLVLITQVIALVYSVVTKELSSQTPTNRKSSELNHNSGQTQVKINDPESLIGAWYEIAQIGNRAEGICECSQLEVLIGSLTGTFEIQQTCAHQKFKKARTTIVNLREDKDDFTIFETVEGKNIKVFTLEEYGNLVVYETCSGVVLLSRNMYFETSLATQILQDISANKPWAGSLLTVRSASCPVLFSMNSYQQSARILQSVKDTDSKKTLLDLLDKYDKKADLLSRPLPVAVPIAGYDLTQALFEKFDYTTAFSLKCKDGYRSYFGAGISKVTCSRFKLEKTDLTRGVKETVTVINIKKPSCTNFKLVKDDGRSYLNITDIVTKTTCLDFKLEKRVYVPPGS